MKYEWIIYRVIQDLCDKLKDESKIGLRDRVASKQCQRRWIVRQKIILPVKSIIPQNLQRSWIILYIRL